jgi:hypothetical protein
MPSSQSSAWTTPEASVDRFGAAPIQSHRQRLIGSPLCQVRGFGTVECASVLVAVKTSDAVRGQAASVGVVVGGVGNAVRSL